MRTASPTKDRIAQTALRLFVEQGVTETTIRHIAAGAGIAEGTIYRHYPSKEELVWELFSSHYTAFAVTLDQLQAAQSGLCAKLDAMVRGFCELYDRDWVLFSFLLIVQHQQLHKLTDDMANPVDVVKQVIADGMAAGECPPLDPDLAAAMVLGIVLRPAIFKLYGRIHPPMSDLSATLSAACRRVLEA